MSAEILTPDGMPVRLAPPIAPEGYAPSGTPYAPVDYAVLSNGTIVVLSQLQQYSPPERLLATGYSIDGTVSFQDNVAPSQYAVFQHPGGVTAWGPGFVVTYTSENDTSNMAPEHGVWEAFKADGSANGGGEIWNQLWVHNLQAFTDGSQYLLEWSGANLGQPYAEYQENAQYGSVAQIPGVLQYAYALGMDGRLSLDDNQARFWTTQYTPPATAIPGEGAGAITSEAAAKLSDATFQTEHFAVAWADAQGLQVAFATATQEVWTGGNPPPQSALPDDVRFSAPIGVAGAGAHDAHVVALHNGGFVVSWQAGGSYYGETFDSAGHGGGVISLAGDAAGTTSGGELYTIGLHEGAYQVQTYAESAPPPATLSISGPGALAEGDSGATDFAFTVTRDGDLSTPVLVDYYQAYGGTADSSDFAGPTAGTVAFASGQSTATIHIAVAGDTTVEPDKTFTIALANSRGATIDANSASAAATILNDDTAASPPAGAHMLTDGGYVVIDNTNSGQFAQKYDAHGAAVGSAVQLSSSLVSVTALSNGGYVLLENSLFVDPVQVIDAANHQSTSFYSGSVSNIAASPNGGFVIATDLFPGGHGPEPDPIVTLYDNAGQTIASSTYEYLALPSLTVDADGRIVATRSGLQPLVIDPAHGGGDLQPPPALPGQITGTDNSGSTPAQFASGATINSTTPIFHVPVSAVGGVELTFTDFSSGGDRGVREIPVTEADVARGYVDIQTRIIGPSNFTYDFKFAAVSPEGLVGAPTTVDVTYVPLVASLGISGPQPGHEGTDFAFTVTRTGDLSHTAAVDYYLAYGGSADSSDFAGPTAGTAYFQAGQSDAVIHIAVAADAKPEPDETFTIALSNARGGAIDAAHQSATATILDGAASGGGGSSSVSTSDPDYTAPSGVHTITLTGTSSQTVHGNNEGDVFWSNNNANTLYGGIGDDTFHLGRNGDHVTGGGGNDTFVFEENPWARSGVITDFNHGDVVDLTPTLQKAGYAGGDPVAEGYIKLTPDAPTMTKIWFNPDPAHSTTFWLVTALTGVDQGSVHVNEGLITV